MEKVLDMAEAHLTNVKQEIERLYQQKEQIVADIENLNNYYNEGLKVVDFHREDAEDAEEVPPSKDTP